MVRDDKDKQLLEPKNIQNYKPKRFFIITLLTSLNHRLNGSSSPVLMATRLSYGSLCDFLNFFIHEYVPFYASCLSLSIT